MQDDLFSSDSLSFYSASYRASRGAEYKKIFISSPNVEWCPWIRCPETAIFIRADGTFGPDDPICWPQRHHSDTPHLACVPLSDPDPASPVYTFRHGLLKNEVAFVDSRDGTFRVATISEHLASTLQSHLKRFLGDVQDFLTTTEGPHPRLTHLVDNLKLAITTIMKSRDTLPQLRLVFGLAARFYLEAHGYINYHLKHRPVLGSDIKLKVNTNLVGVLVANESSCAKYHQMGIPVWLHREHSNVSVASAKFVKQAKPLIYLSRPVWPPGGFRDDGTVRGEDDIFEQPPRNTCQFLMAVDAWAKSKLECTR